MDEKNFDLYSAEAEEGVLGSLLVEPELLDVCILQPEHFALGPRQNLMKTIRFLQSRNVPVTMITIGEAVKNRGDKIEELGGLMYLVQLADQFTTKGDFETYSDIVLSYWKRREQTRIGLALTNGMDTAKAMQQLMDVETYGDNEDDDGSIKDDLVEMYDDIESATGKISGIPSGFRDLDKMTLGWQDGDLIIVGARPSVGKTAYALGNAANAVESANNPNGAVVVIFSAEMTRKKLLRRMAGTLNHIDSQVMRIGAPAFQGEDWRKLTMSMAELSGSNLLIFDKPAMDMRYINKKMRRVRRDHPNSKIFVVVDYLQLLVGDKKHGGNRMQEISEISRQLKQLAREMVCPVMALSQLSRGLEQRQDKRPMMSDLRESGQIEQDADLIQFLYREDYYDKESEDQNIIEVITAKQRDGGTGTVKLAFIKEFGKFVTIDWGQSQGQNEQAKQYQ